MKTVKVIEDEKLLAIFCGSAYENYSYFDKEFEYHELFFWSKPKNIDIGELSDAWSIGYFQFSDSWKWLMIVIKEIESHIFWGKVSDLFQSCVKFVKWYNKNNCTE